MVSISTNINESNNSSMESNFPLEARVILHGLLNASELNGKTGVIRSKLNHDTSRYTVFLESEQKTVGIKPLNLKWEPRTIESLSIKELKMIVKVSNVDKDDVVGTLSFSGSMDKSELQSHVSKLISREDDLPRLLAKAARASRPPLSSTTSGTTTPFTPTMTSSHASQAAEQLYNMSPEQLREHADRMRTMDPNMIRQMNPQLANMNNVQIQQAADQIEMLANNPAMLKMMADQMKNMDPTQFERMQASMTSSPSSSAGDTFTSPPPFAHQHNTASLNNNATTSQMLANMDKDQLKQMLQMMRDNPEMLKQYATMTGMSEEQIQKGIESFANMSDAKLNVAITMMQTVTSVKERWSNWNNKAGGHLLSFIVSALLLVVIAWIVMLWWYQPYPSMMPSVKSPLIVTKDSSGGSDDIEWKTAVEQDDEFADSEF